MQFNTIKSLCESMGIVMLCATWLWAADGGLNLTGRALVAVPQPGYGVFLTWRYLVQDREMAAFDIMRAKDNSSQFEKIGSASSTTTFTDNPGNGTFRYYVLPSAGLLKGKASNIAEVTTGQDGRDWVEIMPAAKGKKIQFCDRHFADTDGDGELEFVTYYPRVPSYRGGQMPESFKIQVYELFDPAQPRWTFDTKMGTQAGSGDKRKDWDYEWTFKPVAHDIDGDYKAEIITLAKMDNVYKYVVLKDKGDSYSIMYSFKSPAPVGDEKPLVNTSDGTNNNRHFPFFADLGGSNYSFCLQTGTYAFWAMWAFDWDGSQLKQRWHILATKGSAKWKGGWSTSHSVLLCDVDGDGRDEINNGVSMIDDNGTLLWHAGEAFHLGMHIDGQNICDIDPRNPGLEVMMHGEQIEHTKTYSKTWAIFDARTGKLLLKKDAPGTHLQLNVAAEVMSDDGLDIIGTYGGHKPQGGFGSTYAGKSFSWPYPSLPRNGDRIWAMDWDGGNGYNVCLNFTSIYGRDAKVLHKLDFSDAPSGSVAPWVADGLHHLWFNVDIVGDYREDIPVQMQDGSVRVYVNTKTPPHRRPCKWQNHAYEMMQAPGDYRYFIKPLGQYQMSTRSAGHSFMLRYDPKQKAGKPSLVFPAMGYIRPSTNSSIYLLNGRKMQLQANAEGQVIIGNINTKWKISRAIDGR